MLTVLRNNRGDLLGCVMSLYKIIDPKRDRDSEHDRNLAPVEFAISKPRNWCHGPPSVQGQHQLCVAVSLFLQLFLFQSLILVSVSMHCYGVPSGTRTKNVFMPNNVTLIFLCFLRNDVCLHFRSMD